MNVEQWQKFLKRYSTELLAEDSEIEVDEEIHQSHWMGYERAARSS